MINKNIILIAFSLLLCSCSDWLDVTPKAQIREDKLFETYNGYEDAVYGVYSNMTNNSLYGRDLMYGFVDVLAQYYKTPAGHRYEYSSKYEYNNKECIKILENTWLKSYNTIANCNVILENLNKVDESFFPENEYNLIKAEMLGIRALLHFDMLRLFSPRYKGNENKKAIPFADKWTKYVHKQLTSSELIEKITTDLTTSRNLLKDIDPIFLDEYKTEWYYKFWQQATRIDFMDFRGYRFNYFAATALLARVHLYINDKPSAYSYAKEIIDAVDEGYFSFVKENEISNSKTIDNDYVGSRELIFSLNTINITKDYIKDSKYSKTRLEIEGINSIFETSDDYRKMYLTGKNSSNKTISLKFYHGAEEFGRKIPMIKISEMYLIAAEAIFETNPTEAVEYVEKLIFKRGMIKEISETTSIQDFIDIIVNEYRKEFISEGQAFFCYKRLNLPVKKGSGNIEMNDQTFTPPIPSVEVQYGDRES